MMLYKNNIKVECLIAGNVTNNVSIVKGEEYDYKIDQ